MPASFTEVYSCPSLPSSVKWAWACEKENYVQDAMEFMAAFGFLGHQGLCGKGELLLLGVLAQVGR